MAFRSILFEDIEPAGRPAPVENLDFMIDLNLNPIIDAVVAGKQEYDLKPYFYTPLHERETVQYRHEIMQDLEDGDLMGIVQSFAGKMTVIRRHLAMIEKLDSRYHREGWTLEAASEYGEMLTALVRGLEQVDLKSRGFLSLREYVRAYTCSENFQTFLREIEALKNELSTVKYCVEIKSLTVKVRKFEEGADYSQEVVETFEKFKQGAVKDYRTRLGEEYGMNRVEAQILDCVAGLYPQIFADLDRFCEQRGRFMDETFLTFDREVQFYVAYLEYIANLKRAGLRFCYPQISTTSKEIYDYEGFDLALAHKRISERDTIVWNDFYLKEQERIVVVTGPNQGGKTTFARTIGQLHYLASLGLPVPGQKAGLFLFDHIFTHFEKEENIQNLRGKLQDDLVRIAAILDQATPNSLIIMNEIFTSTTLKDALFLSEKIMEKIIRLDLLCVFVTFLDELAALSEKTVSMVSTVAPDNPAQRTFKIVRKPADGLSYALSIAEKHRVTYDCIRERIRS